MLIDLQGRINNIHLATSRALLPLFEAVVNSFQSIEDKEDKTNAYIKIQVIRDEVQTGLNLEDKSNNAINSFIVEDNGVGFNSINLQSFETSDSTFKKHRGGKGVGRLLWLKAFRNVEIESIFFENNHIYQRNFAFKIDTGISNPICIETKNLEQKTTIHLKNYYQQYKQVCPKKLETIAMRIIEHCLSYFLLQECPKVYLSDDRETICLNRMCSDSMHIQFNSDSLTLKGQEFNLLHVKLYASEENTHKIHLCANCREVYNKKVAPYIPNLNKKIKDDEGNSFLYLGYLSGEYLDSCVNSERTDFNLEEDNGELDFPDQITKADLMNMAVESIKRYLAEYLEPIKQEKLERIQSFIQNESPQYRPIMKYKEEILDSISPDISKEALDIELYKITQKFDLELKEKGEKLLKKDLSQIENYDKYREEYTQFVEQSNDLGKSNLAKYIIHRKVILDLLEVNLQRRCDDKYPLEESVHGIIFPLRTTSDIIDYEKQNLWVIDEKLSYHYFLASDMPFNQLEALNVDGLERPDLLIYNKPLVFVGDVHPYSSVVIIEFKRPGRKQYDEDKDPIAQVFNYIKKIRQGNEVDRKGRPINIHGNTPFYGYIICDITSKVQDFAENASLMQTPDGEGYFGYNKNRGAYIEVISYDKLLSDAQKRNKILFDKLFKSGINR